MLVLLCFCRATFSHKLSLMRMLAILADHLLVDRIRSEETVEAGRISGRMEEAGNSLETLAFQLGSEDRRKALVALVVPVALEDQEDPVLEASAAVQVLAVEGHSNGGYLHHRGLQEPPARSPFESGSGHSRAGAS